MSSASTAEHGDGKMAEVSRAMVGIYKEQFGRGPTRARSAFANRDTLICTLEDSMTRAEHKLVELGELQRMRELRLYFQHATEEDFINAVETIIGRKVHAFISGMDVRKDVSCEVFVFETSDGSSREG